MTELPLSGLGSCIYYFTATKSWKDAQGDCASHFAGQLAVPSDREEHEAMAPMLDGRQFSWVGVYRNDRVLNNDADITRMRNNYRTESIEVVAAEFWQDNEPTNEQMPCGGYSTFTGGDMPRSKPPGIQPWVCDEDEEYPYYCELPRCGNGVLDGLHERCDGPHCPTCETNCPDSAIEARDGVCWQRTDAQEVESACPQQAIGLPLNELESTWLLGMTHDDAWVDAHQEAGLLIRDNGVVTPVGLIGTVGVGQCVINRLHGGWEASECDVNRPTVCEFAAPQ
jgi:hypothetical protein